MSSSAVSSPPPLQFELKTVRIGSNTLAVLMGLMSLAGLLFPDVIYPSEELKQTYLTNDLVNLVLGLPILLGSMWLARRGSLLGLLFWPGALLYSFYNYTAYVFGIPFGWTTGVNLVIVLLSGYLTLVLYQGIDGRWIQEQIAGKVPEKIGGWVLILFGVVFIFRSLGVFASGMPPLTELGVLIADLILSAFWIAGGVLLLRKRPRGYASSTGLLFAGAALFTGLIAFLLLQPLFTEAPFDLAGVAIILVMSLICFVPFGLFVRGVLASGTTFGS